MQMQTNKPGTNMQCNTEKTNKTAYCSLSNYLKIYGFLYRHSHNEYLCITAYLTDYDF